jgi:hypothetical protein
MDGGMMSTPIENFLYGNGGIPAVTGFAMQPEVIRLRLAPWEDLENSTEAVFGGARITSIDVYADDAEDLNLPWDIIGVESYELDGRRWLFVLHCGGIEYGFEAEWPTLTDWPASASNQV